MGFCPNCGKRTKGDFCEGCKPVSELKAKDIDVKFCASCKRYFHKNKWAAAKDLTTAIARVAKDSIKESKLLRIKPLIADLKLNPGIKENISIEVTRGDELFIIPGKISVSYCNNCAKMQGQYFEGTLQLRNVNDKILDFITSYMKTNNAFISNKIETDNGYDLDISDQRKLQNLGHLLKKNFGGNLIISIRQFTQNRLTSRQIYRVNALYQGPDYAPGEVIKVEKNIYVVTSVRKNVSGIDLKTSKKSSIELKNKEYSVLKPKKTTVSKVYPNLEVIDPETYQSVPLVNRKEVKLGEKVKIVNDNGLFYII